MAMKSLLGLTRKFLWGGGHSIVCLTYESTEYTRMWAKRVPKAHKQRDDHRTGKIAYA